MPNEARTIVVWFSCGVASAVAASETIKRYGTDHIVRVVNNPVAEEDSDNRRFLADVAAWIGRPIEIAANEKWPTNSARDVWEKRSYMGGPLPGGGSGAPCTAELKRAARHQWEARNHFDHMVLGFTAEEKKRFDRFVLTERSNVLPVLIDAGLTKADCHRIILDAGIAPPRVYALGYPNANCIGCVKATSATYWNLVRKTHPEVFADRAEQSRRIGKKLVRPPGNDGARIFLDKLDPSVTGRTLKSFMPDCGIFCEEKEAA
jgi:hypothetical protein